jgi:hypothetical protein
LLPKWDGAEFALIRLEAQARAATNATPTIAFVFILPDLRSRKD